MKRLLLLIILIVLVGCATTPIKSIKEASPVSSNNVFYKSENSINNVIFLRDSGFMLSGNPAYLFMKTEPNYEKIKLADLGPGEMVGFSLKEGEYTFHVEGNPIFVGLVENEIFQKIESNKTYIFRIFPSQGFQIQRTSLKN